MVIIASDVLHLINNFTDRTSRTRLCEWIDGIDTTIALVKNSLLFINNGLVTTNTIAPGLNEEYSLYIPKQTKQGQWNSSFNW